MDEALAGLCMHAAMAAVTQDRLDCASSLSKRTNIMHNGTCPLVQAYAQHRVAQRFMGHQICLPNPSVHGAHVGSVGGGAAKVLAFYFVSFDATSLLHRATRRKMGTITPPVCPPLTCRRQYRRRTRGCLKRHTRVSMAKQCRCRRRCHRSQLAVGAASRFLSQAP